MGDTEMDVRFIVDLLALRSAQAWLWGSAA